NTSMSRGFVNVTVSTEDANLIVSPCLPKARALRREPGPWSAPEVTVTTLPARAGSPKANTAARATTQTAALRPQRVTRVAVTAALRLTVVHQNRPKTLRRS